MISPVSLARTFDPESLEDGGEALLLYYAIRGYGDEHPDLAGTALARRFPRVSTKTVYRWLDGNSGRIVAAVESAENRGWFDVGPNDDMGEGLCVLLTAVYSCGWVRTDYACGWTPSSITSHAAIESALRELEIEHRVEDSSDEDPNIVAAEDGTLLGRCLTVLGSPLGKKSESNVQPFPDCIFETDDETRRTCARLFCAERGSTSRSETTLQLRLARRSDEFKRSVRDLILSVTDGEVTSGETVTVSADAVRDLDLQDQT